MSERQDDLKVIVVGGAGAMGRWAVRNIVKLGSASTLTIADIDLPRAERFSAEVGAPCVARQLDATDPSALRAAFSGHDVVLNTMGPFATFAGPILEAALDSDCHYLDIDDDWESTLEAFELDAKARERGLHVVIGLGGSPGVTNLCAALAARSLDTVEDILTGWKLSGAVAEEDPNYPTGSASAALEHWLIQCSGTIRVWQGGATVDVRPVEERPFHFPGIGDVTAYTMGHPEPLTLPRTFPDLINSVNLQSGPAWLFDHVRSVAAEFDAGEISLADGAQKMTEPTRPEGDFPRDPLPIEWAIATGLKDGRRTSIAAYPNKFPPGRMGGNTGVPLAIGLELLRRGLMRDVGVHAPESVIDVDAFFELLAPLTDPSYASAADLLVVSTHEHL